MNKEEVSRIFDTWLDENTELDEGGPEIYSELDMKDLIRSTLMQGYVSSIVLRKRIEELLCNCMNCKKSLNTLHNAPYARILTAIDEEVKKNE